MATGKSLHIGVNRLDPAHYDGWDGPLAACEFDADSMQEIASAQGFETAVLKTAEATRDAVISGIRAASSVLASGDIFLLTYAGHGGQVPDENFDEEDDAADETWCLHDGQLIDDELAVLWSEFAAGTRIAVFSDSCHSGTVTRAVKPESERVDLTGTVAEELGIVNAGSRLMPTQEAEKTYRTNRKFYDQIQQSIPVPLPEIQASVRLVSACQDDEEALDGTFNGLFTGQLKRIWRNGAFEGDYEAFQNAILDKVQEFQHPNYFVHGPTDHDFATQRPFTI